jgi:hypothetical protein
MEFNGALILTILAGVLLYIRRKRVVIAMLVVRENIRILLLYTWIVVLAQNVHLYDEIHGDFTIVCTAFESFRTLLLHYRAGITYLERSLLRRAIPTDISYRIISGTDAFADIFVTIPADSKKEIQISQGTLHVKIGGDVVVSVSNLLDKLVQQDKPVTVEMMEKLLRHLKGQ